VGTPKRADSGPRSTQSVKDRVEQKLREGHRPRGLSGVGPGAIFAAARDAVAEGEFDTIRAFSTAAYSLPPEMEPDWSLYVPPRRQQPVPRAVLLHAPAPEPALTQPAGQARRILVIGDLHQDPRHEHRLDVLTWIARYASEHRFERIIQVGDWSTFDCASTHDKNETLAGRLRPGFKDDLANLTASHQAFRRGMSDDYRPKLDFLMGNHENRLERWENVHPESVGTFTLARDETFAQFGWRSRPYGELHYVEGVGFAHHATNGAGRAFGGKTGPQRGANETTVPVVGGHTHRKQMHDAPKIGPLDVISMVEVGCAMPWGEVEAYISHGAPTGWWWGVVPMTVQGGLITDLSFVSMLTIRSRYSGDGADVRAA
jgi:hypothetical protein